MRFVCDRRALAEERERRAKFFRTGTSRVSGLGSRRRGNAAEESGARTERGRVHQICEEYTRRSQSFAVRLRETTIYSRGKSHTHSWISAKRLYYRQYCAGCVALGVARSTFPGFAVAIAPTYSGPVILFARSVRQPGRRRLRGDKMRGRRRRGPWRFAAMQLWCISRVARTIPQTIVRWGGLYFIRARTPGVSLDTADRKP